MPQRYRTDYRIGQDNLRRFGMDLHNPVFCVTAVLILIFVMGMLMAPDPAKAVFASVKGWSVGNFDWLFMFGGNIFALFCLGLIVSPFGKTRLGGLDGRTGILDAVLALHAVCCRHGRRADVLERRGAHRSTGTRTRRAGFVWLWSRRSRLCTAQANVLI